MKEIKLTYSDDEFAMIQRVANRRKSSVRSLLLRMCYDLDFKQQKREYEKGPVPTKKKRRR